MLLTFVSVATLRAQERVITGTLKDATTQEGVPGVNVLVQGTTTGTITDIDGKYSLPVPADATMLVYSAIGYETQTVEIGNRTSIDLAMKESIEQLSEVVVTAFGIEREKKALGYTVQEIDGKAFAEAKQASVVNNLSGRIAGVQVNSNGGPGSGSQIVIRGFSSVGGNNQPLVVIDGVPMENAKDPLSADDNRFGGGLSEINPDNIANVSVLKGPNAAALYGSRAANGVILVTTKNGARTKGIGVDLSASMSFENPLVKPDFQDIYGGGSGYRTWYADGWSGTVDGYKGTSGTDESWGSPMDGRPVRQWWTGTETTPLLPMPDNWEQHWRTGVTQTYNAGISAGGEKGSFRLGIGSFNQTGIMDFNDFHRYNFRFNSNYDVTDKLKASISAEYIKSGSDNRSYQSSQNFIWHHRQTDYDKLRNWRDYVDVHIQRPGDDLPPNWQHTYFTNPYFLQEMLPYGNEKDRMLGNLALTYQFTPWLSLMARSGTDVWSDSRTNIINFERTKGGTFTPGAFSEEMVRRQETNSDVILTFDKTIQDAFSVRAQLGAVNRRNTDKTVFSQVNQLVIDGIYSLNNNRNPNTDRSYKGEKVVNSVFGAATLGWRNALFLDLTARNDWSSTLPAANRSFFYPSASLSAVLTDLLPISSPLLSFAKVRGSWAQVGSDTEPYNLRATYQASSPWNGSVPAFYESNTIFNPNLKPEITTGVELGIDLRFLNGRLGLDVTHYNQTTRDQILAVSISQASGYASRYLNAGEITNKGWEVMISGTPVKTATGFTWDVALNWSRNRNQVVELADGLTNYVLWTERGVSSEARVGQSYGSLYGIAYARTDDGQIIFENGLPTTNPTLQVIGNITPKWLGGLNNTFTYKGISLSALIDTRWGGDIFDMGSSLMRNDGIVEETAVGREEGVIGLGVMNVGSAESPVYVPNTVVADATTFYKRYSGRQYHEAGVFDASYIKLRQASLSYQLPSSLFEHIFIKSARISAVGRNLAILYRRTPHIDPEVDEKGGNRQGYTYGTLPSSRSIGFNVNLSF